MTSIEAWSKTIADHRRFGPLTVGIASYKNRKWNPAACESSTGTTLIYRFMMSKWALILLICGEISSYLCKQSKTKLFNIPNVVESMWVKILRPQRLLIKVYTC